MAKSIDIYGNEKRLKTAISTLKESKLNSEDKKDIKDFIDTMQAQGIKPIRLVKNVYVLKKLGLMKKIPYRKATKQDIIKIIGKIESNKDYAQWTKADFKIVLKRFFKWLKGNEEVYPEEVKWIKNKEPKNKLLPEELLTEEEIMKLVNAANHPRDKAFIFTLYESGARISEMLTLRIKHINFGEQVTWIMVNGKTGQRRIPLVAATPYLATWLNMHPLQKKPEAFLWTKIALRQQQGRSAEDEISYSTARKTLQKIFKKAKINKKFNPHLFRHSRATFLANHLTEAQLKELFGWVQSSDMASRYIHLSGRDVDNALLGVYGLRKKEEVNESKLKQRPCPRCKEGNPPNASYCFKCAAPLDVPTVQKAELERKTKEKAITKYMENPQVFFEKFQEYLSQQAKP